MNVFLKNRLKLIFIANKSDKEISLDDISWSNKIIKENEEIASDIYEEAEVEVIRMGQRK